MNFFSTNRLKSFFLLALSVLSGCSYILEDNFSAGTKVTDEQMTLFTQTTTRDDVLRVLGSPSVISLDDKSKPLIYYYQQTVKDRVLISEWKEFYFDEQDRLSKVLTYHK